MHEPPRVDQSRPAAAGRQALGRSSERTEELSACFSIFPSFPIKRSNFSLNRPRSLLLAANSVYAVECSADSPRKSKRPSALCQGIRGERGIRSGRLRQAIVPRLRFEQGEPQRALAFDCEAAVKMTRSQMRGGASRSQGGAVGGVKRGRCRRCGSPRVGGRSLRDAGGERRATRPPSSLQATGSRAIASSLGPLQPAAFAAWFGCQPRSGDHSWSRGLPTPSGPRFNTCVYTMVVATSACPSNS